MLNIRTTVLSVVLVLLLILTAQWVTARTDVVSNQSRGPSSVFEIQAQSADMKNLYSAPSYRAQFGECFDVSIRDLAACRDADPIPAPASHSPIDECFDVSLWEIASCENSSPVPVFSYRSRLDECFDVPLSELASCRNANQVSAP
jgi:hypothetical protein